MTVCLFVCVCVCIFVCIRNVLDNPHEEHYKKIKTTNKSFSRKVWQHSQAKEFMLSSGWTLVSLCRWSFDGAVEW